MFSILTLKNRGKRKNTTKCNKNVLGTPYSYYLHLCDGWNWGHRARGCLLLAYVGSMCFTFCEKAFKMCTFWVILPLKCLRTRSWRSPTHFVLLGCADVWAAAILVIECHAEFIRKAYHNIIWKASLHAIWSMKCAAIPQNSAELCSLQNVTFLSTCRCFIFEMYSLNIRETKRCYLNLILNGIWILLFDLHTHKA